MLPPEIPVELTLTMGRRRKNKADSMAKLNDCLEMLSDSIAAQIARFAMRSNSKKSKSMSSSEKPQLFSVEAYIEVINEIRTQGFCPSRNTFATWI